ncbi:MAG: heptaprenyl diphosphate synthase [Gammaproteobacteria bacterium]|nr:MAG: heptaprenyl diphosphate synthase [Gammaproteobacteria bacterium]
MKLYFTTTHADHKIALLAALAITIHIIESAFPSPLPGIKPGLANVITLFTFIKYGWKTALQVSLLRVIISSLLLGTFLSPTFLLSLSGALLSLISLILIQLPFRQFSLAEYQPGAVGYAIVASISHMSGQFLVAWYFFIPHPGLFKLLPIFITFAVILGLVSGIITQLLINQIQCEHN